MKAGLLAATALAFHAASAGQPVSDEAAARPPSGHILVTFPSPPRLLNRRAGSGFKGYAGGAYRDNVTTDFLTRGLSRDYPLQAVDDWPIKALEVHCVLYRVRRQRPVEPLMARLADDPRVESVQRLQHFRVQQAEDQPVEYDDPYYELQHSWRELDLAQAHRVTTGRGVTVAVIDTAVDREHPDLRNRVRRRESFVAEAHRSSGDFHGTAVAGVMAADANNGTGIVGVAPRTDLLALEACWAAGEGAQCDSFTLAQALSYAIDHGAQIINLSLAGPRDPLLSRLVDAALDRGIVVVAAYSERADQLFPASMPGVIAVDRSESRRSPDTEAATARIAAPGRDILTTVPGPAYDFASGASIAAAHVSGMIALLFQLKPSPDVNRLSEVIRTATSATGGRVNACELLRAAHAGPAEPLHCKHSTLVAR